jgi:hypothetical protein
VALTVGCGQTSVHIYSLAKTKTCLQSKQVRLGGPLDFVASTATGGAVKIRLSDNFLTLVFGKNVSDANNLDAFYRRVAAKNVGIDDVLRQEQNAVMLWHLHPSDADLGLVTGCLK